MTRRVDDHSTGQGDALGDAAPIGRDRVDPSAERWRWPGLRDVEQAKGILRLALNIDEDDAFEVLRHYSNITDMTVRDLAARLVAHAHHTSVPHERLAPLLDALELATGHIRARTAAEGGPRAPGTPDHARERQSP